MAKPGTKAAMKQKIEAVLMRPDEVGMHAVGRALVALYHRQTSDEQASLEVHHHNGEGFATIDADIGTQHARFYKERKFLTPKMVAMWRKPFGTTAKPRILRYATQLTLVAREKEYARTMGEQATHEARMAAYDTLMADLKRRLENHAEGSANDVSAETLRADWTGIMEIASRIGLSEDEVRRMPL
jgi:hypothetical protein